MELRDLRRHRDRDQEADEHRRAAERRHRPSCARSRRSAATIAPIADASRRTTKVSRNVRRRAATAKTIDVAAHVRVPATGSAASSGYGVNLAQRRSAASRDVAGARPSSSGLRSTGAISAAISAISRLAHARGGDRGGAEAEPARDERLLGVVRDRVLVAGDPGPVERLLRHLAGDPERAQVDEHQVVVGAARHDAEALVRRAPPASACALRTICAAYSRNPGCARLVERDRLRRDHVLERAALEAREHGLVDRGRVLARGRGSRRRAGRAASCAS